MTKAVFLSRTSAYAAAAEAALADGYTTEEANMRCRVYARFSHGVLIGFEAWYPCGTGARPVLED